MKPVELENPDIRLAGPEDVPECGELTAVIDRDGHGRKCFVSLWTPTIEEIRALAKGGCVALSIAGAWHPPVALGVMDKRGNVVDG